MVLCAALASREDGIAFVLTTRGQKVDQRNFLMNSHLEKGDSVSPDLKINGRNRQTVSQSPEIMSEQSHIQSRNSSCNL
jgi:hypothetical protein